MLIGVLSCLTGACASGTPTPASPTEVAPTDGASAEPTVSKGEPPLTLPPAPSAVPEPPAECEAFRSAASSPTPPADCLSELAAALRIDAPAARDLALQALERCPWGAPLTVRALRAELAPAACGDVVVGDAVTKSEAPRDVRELLFALASAGRLRRLAQTPPEPPLERTKEALQAYFREQLFPWVGEQAAAIHEVATSGAALHGYPRGIVAIEAGMADMRFVEMARQVPIPIEFADDAELRDVYYGSLDEALEPRKTRGRDAALVGLRDYYAVGVLEDARLEEARGLLSRVFGGGRIDALDRLMVPEMPPAPASPTAGEQLAMALPTYYAGVILGALPNERFSPESPSGLRALLERGLPRAVRLDLASRSELAPEVRSLLLRGHFELGRTYFAAEEFAQVQRLAKASSADGGDRTSVGVPQFFEALATALMAGPRDAAALILRGPRFADALGNLAALDELAGSSRPLSGQAAFNAAYLRELVAPPEARKYWMDLEQRYLAAARKLPAPEATISRERARAARETAQAIPAE